MRTTAALVFTGSFQPASFVAFAEHRAMRLGLRMRLGRVDAHCVAVSLAGEADLIDMFEVACSLGPIDCLVRNIERGDADGL